MKVVLAILALVFGLLALVEVCLRAFLGSPLIYIADDQIGYLLAPNQRVRRFGNRIEINQYSMRTSAINPSPANSTFRVLLLGDSVANGGWWTDQKETISQMMTDFLGVFFTSGDEKTTKLGFAGGQANATPDLIGYSSVEVLNASANSWGPRNELAYLQKFGLFEAAVVVLLINTDDLFGKIPSSLVVGRDRNYPDRQMPTAIAEVFSRYLLPAPKVPELTSDSDLDKDVVAANLEAIREIQKTVEKANRRLILAMTPLLREVGEPGSRDYEIKTRQRLNEFAQQQRIIYLDFLPIFKSSSDPGTLYRDHIHLSPEGNRVVSQTLIESIIAIAELENQELGIENRESGIDK